MKKNLLMIVGIILMLPTSLFAQSDSSGLYLGPNKMLYYKHAPYLGTREQLLSFERYKITTQPNDDRLVILLQHNYRSEDSTAVRMLFVQTPKMCWVEKAHYQGTASNNYAQIVGADIQSDWGGENLFVNYQNRKGQKAFTVDSL